MSEPEPHLETVARETNSAGHSDRGPSESDAPDVAAADAEPLSPAQSGWRRFALTRGDQFFVAFIVVVASIFMFAHWLRLSGWGMRPVEIELLEPMEHVFQVDVNRATWVEWAQLDGIGPALAHRIVADREQHGPFKTIDDVQRVPGIGPKRLEQLRPWLAIDVSEQ